MVAGVVSAGVLIAGRYRLADELGRGGMAIVFRAHDQQLGRDVALKLLQLDAAAGTEFASALIQEARAAASLPHPNIVTVFDAGEHEGQPFIVLELVSGGDLRALLRARGRLDAGEAARLGCKIASGLAAVHARGLVHCDVKPQNVLLTTERRPKLIDFGISRSATAVASTRPDAIVGSAAYLSPEQVQGAPLDARTDVYALGIVLYEMLAGQPPYSGATLAEVAAKRLQLQARPIRQVAPETPPALAAIVERAMARDPAARYADGGELAEALAPLASRAVGPDARTTKIAVDRPLPGARRAPAAAPVSPSSGPRPGPSRVERRRAAPRWWLLAGVAAILLIAIAALGRTTVQGLGTGSVTAELVEVPAVAGSSFERAQEILRQSGLEPVRGEEQVTLDTPRGLVITQDPLEGKQLRKGERVTLLVSRGIEVPNLVGRHWDEVKPWLDQHGWSLGQVRFIFADRRDFGKVVWQDPPAGAGPAADKRGTPISLNVAGPPEATKTGFPRVGGAPSQPSAPQPAPTAPTDPPRGQQAKPGRQDQRQPERRQQFDQRDEDSDD